MTEEHHHAHASEVGTGSGGRASLSQMRPNGEADRAHPGRLPEIDATGAMYTCPMHPEYRQAGPGNCPICGMTLEPFMATQDTGPSPELVDMTRRLWIGAALAAPVFALAMGAHFLGLRRLIAPQTSSWI